MAHFTGVTVLNILARN